MADVATQRISGSLNPTYSAASAGGDTVTPGPKTFLHVRNTDTASHDVTITTPATSGGLAVEDPTYTVPAGDELLIGPLTSHIYRNSSGLVDLAWSATTGMDFAALAI